MTTMAIVTPSYLPDLEAFFVLHRSVLEHTAPEVLHHVIVPMADQRKFAERRSERLVVHGTDEQLPQRFLNVHGLTKRARRFPMGRRLASIQYINPRNPFPPVRGWMIQQVVKLQMAATLDVDVVVTIDSDTALIRDLPFSHVRSDGVVRFYRSATGVHSGMPNHLRWHATAERLLGLATITPPMADYITPLMYWDTRLVRHMRRVLEERHSRDWRELFCSLTSFSECILYGRFVDEIAGGPAAQGLVTEVEECLVYWDSTPLTSATLDDLLGRARGDEYAIDIQSVSDTPLELRLAAINEAENRARDGC